MKSYTYQGLEMHSRLEACSSSGHSLDTSLEFWTCPGGLDTLCGVRVGLRHVVGYLTCHGGGGVRLVKAGVVVIVVASSSY